MNNEFNKIFSKYDTDKISAGYDIAYEEAFRNIRDEVRLVFEIGVNRGGSVRAFKEYFPNALIVGLEINGHCYFEEDRIKIEIGDATDGDFIQKILKTHGCPDIVVDDGSHFSNHIKASFKLLHPYTKGGYVIEDLGTQTSKYENGFYVKDGVPATIIIKSMIEELLLGMSTCKSIKIYKGICIFLK